MGECRHMRYLLLWSCLALSHISLSHCHAQTKVPVHEARIPRAPRAAHWTPEGRGLVGQEPRQGRARRLVPQGPAGQRLAHPDHVIPQATLGVDRGRRQSSMIPGGPGHTMCTRSHTVKTTFMPRISPKAKGRIRRKPR